MAESVEEMAALQIIAPLFPKAVINEFCSGRKYIPYLERKRLRRQWAIERAWWRQRQIAKEVRQREYRYVDGLGQLKAIVDPVLEAGTRDMYGRQAFHDPDHLNYILKEHPELRVPTPKPRFLMVNGFKKQAADTAATTENTK